MPGEGVKVKTLNMIKMAESIRRCKDTTRPPTSRATPGDEQLLEQPAAIEG